jgi:hypothetical protein
MSPLMGMLIQRILSRRLAIHPSIQYFQTIYGLLYVH